MKKILFTALFATAATLLLPGSLHANPLSVLQNTQIRTQQTVSVNNLANLYLTATNFLQENQKYPKLDELNLPVRSLANPYHGLGVSQQLPEKITDATSGYAYFGAALNGTNPAAVAGITPFAFEKPTIRPDGKIVILYLDGKTATVDTKAKNVAGVIAELKKGIEKPNETVWGALEKAAKAIDTAVEEAE